MRTTEALYLFRLQPVTASISSERRNREFTQPASEACYGLAGQSVSPGVILSVLVMFGLAQTEPLAYTSAGASEGFIAPAAPMPCSRSTAVSTKVVFYPLRSASTRAPRFRPRAEHLAP